MEQTVDETLLSHDGQVDHPKTCINGSTSSDSHLREDQSESSDSRKRAGWSSFQSDRFIQDKRVCRDFLRGKCVRGISCKFAHSESDAQEGYKTYVCNDFLLGRCNRVSCKFLHPESDRSNGCGSAGNDNLGTSANSGKSQFYGENRYHDPRSSSFPRRNRSRSPCRRFQDGTCYSGESCSYLHSDYGAFNRSRNDYITPLQRGVATTSRYRDFGEAHKGNTLWTSQEHTYVRSRNDVTPPWHRGRVTTSGNPNFGRGRVDMNEGNAQSTGSFYAGQRSRSLCRDFNRGMCNRGAHCPYLHTNAGPRDDCATQKQQQLVEISENPGFPEGSVHVTRSFSGGYRSKSPCRDYLRGRCSRGARCPYLHLDNDTYVRPKDACSTHQLHEVAATSENPGVVEGREGIILRTSQEHKDAIMDEDLSSSDFPRRPRGRSPCRKFLSGRCYRGASCYFLHPETHGYYSENTTPRSRSPDRQQSRPLGNLGVDKTRPEVCLHYCRGRCTLGESCRYLHSFHEYAKSASDCTKPHHSGGMHQHDSSMMREELDGSSDEKTRGKYADNVENPNTTDAKDEAGVGDQQKCEVSEVDEKNNLFRRSFKRRRSSSRSPSTPRDNIDGRKTRRDESQDNFNGRRSRSGSSPLTPRDYSGYRKIRNDESYNNFPRGRCHNVAPFRYPYSHSYRYNGPRYYMNKEPQSSYGISENPNVMETQGRDEAVSHEMQPDQCPNTVLDSSTQIVSVKDFVQPSIVDQGVVEKPVSKGENAVGSVVESDTTCLCGENRSSPMDTNTCTLNKDDNAEMETDLSRDGSEKSDSKKQALNSLSQPDTSGARVSDNTQNVVTISHAVLQLEQGNEVVTKEIQNNVSVEGTTNNGSAAVGYSETNSMQTSQSLVKSTISSPRRKLLVLDVNGLLADIVNVGEVPRGYKPDTIIAMKAVFKRPHCDDFLEFCFDRFDVGIWSSRNKKNVDRVLDFLIFNTKKRLLFCWDQAHCTETGYKTIENRDKPLVLKELKKLWEKQVTDLPWEKGFYDETNTVLLDDSPYKALCNPPYTAIFPYAYKFRDTRDRSLGRSGDLRVYLEKLAATDNIQKFIEENPFGQRAITKSNLSWGFYSKIIRANQQEGSSSNAPAMKVAMSRATESAADHTQQPEGNADKAPASKDLGAHLDREDGNVDNTLVNQQGIPHITTDIKVVARENQQKGNTDNNSDTKVVAHETQLEENFDNTTDIKVVATENRQEEKADNSVDTNFVAHETQQEANADNNSDTKVVDPDTQLEENFDSTTDIKVVASENQHGEKADNSADTNFVAHETQQEANALSTHVN